MESDRSRFKRSLQSYQPEFEVERAFKEAMLELLNYPNCFERSLLHAHFTGSAWVVNQDLSKALLTHHAKLDKWLQLGGHADGMENIAEVAKKELQEESGLRNFKLFDDQIFDLDIHTIPERKGVPEHEHFDVRYLFLTDEKEALSINHESKEMAWVPLSSIAQLCNKNDSIMRMIKKTEVLKHKMSVQV